MVCQFFLFLLMLRWQYFFIVTGLVLQLFFFSSFLIVCIKDCLDFVYFHFARLRRRGFGYLSNSILRSKTLFLAFSTHPFIFSWEASLFLIGNKPKTYLFWITNILLISQWGIFLHHFLLDADWYKNTFC